MKKITDDEPLELYRQGKTNREIADVLKVSQAAVHYRIERYPMLGLKEIRKDSIYIHSRLEIRLC